MEQRTQNEGSESYLDPFWFMIMTDDKAGDAKRTHVDSFWFITKDGAKDTE